MVPFGWRADRGGILRRGRTDDSKAFVLVSACSDGAGRHRLKRCVSLRANHRLSCFYDAFRINNDWFFITSDITAWLCDMKGEIKCEEQKRISSHCVIGSPELHLVFDLWTLLGATVVTPLLWSVSSLQVLCSRSDSLTRLPELKCRSDLTGASVVPSYQRVAALSFRSSLNWSEISMNDQRHCCSLVGAS